MHARAGSVSYLMGTSSVEEGNEADDDGRALETSTSLPPLAASAKSAEWAKWTSLGLLVLQNSSLFVVTRYSRLPDHNGMMYISSVVVLVVELCKMLICLGVLSAGGPAMLFAVLWQHVWNEREQTARLAIPAFCYALQNNLIFLAISNLSAAAAQVLYQLKTLTTAFFSVVILGRSFAPAQWFSFVLLGASCALVQSQDAKSSSAPTGAAPAVGVVAALAAASLSGFAGVYLEKMFTSGSTSLWMRNVQLGLFAIPLQVVAICQWDLAAVQTEGLFQGWSGSTWAVVAVQVAGALLTAFVIKLAGNVLKTFATVLALLCTCFTSVFLFDFSPTPLFGIGVAMTALSIWLYAYPSLRGSGNPTHLDRKDPEVRQGLLSQASR